MKINVAGAGAGKTTGLAEAIIEKHKYMSKDKNIYCIAFTNNAVESIRKKLLKHYGVIPHNIIISTIHSFLYNEFISPYYFLLFGHQFKSVSTIELSTVQSYKNLKLREIESKGLLHIEKIPERAKWVISKKSGDNKHTRATREIIQKAFLSYCSIIFVDEAQDIDSNMKEIFLSLDSIGVDVVLNGDPKQDLRGYGCFRELIVDNADIVIYNPNCYRCPKEHLELSNSLVLPEEAQTTEKCGGVIEIVFEKDCCIAETLEEAFDLKYIYKKNNRFDTHSKRTQPTQFDTLYYEVYDSLLGTESDVRLVEIKAYNYTYAMLKLYKSKHPINKIMERLIQHTGALTKQQYAKIAGALTDKTTSEECGFVVNSIESIKGLEGDRCLFILTPDLAAYLFGRKTDENKTKNALYVALTRSLNSLTTLICTEVEVEYGRDTISQFFSSI